MRIDTMGQQLPSRDYILLPTTPSESAFEIYMTWRGIKPLFLAIDFMRARTILNPKQLKPAVELRNTKAVLFKEAIEFAIFDLRETHWSQPVHAVKVLCPDCELLGAYLFYCVYPAEVEALSRSLTS